MRTLRVIPLLAAVAALVSMSAGPAAAQTPDLSGLWQATYTPNLAQTYGKALPFTPHGAERWKKVETKNDPTGLCLPVGPARGIQAPFPLQFVQTKDTFVVLHEYQHTY